jgi:hypothetical protein
VYDALSALGGVDGDLQFGEMRLPLLEEQAQRSRPDGHAVGVLGQPDETTARRAGLRIDERDDA